MGVGTQTAEATLFLQFEDDSEMEGVFEVQGSCLGLVMFYGRCLITLFLCPKAEIEVGTSYGLFLNLKQTNATWLSRSVEDPLMCCISLS